VGCGQKKANDLLPGALPSALDLQDQIKNFGDRVSLLL
jgi:hypothetical protein